MFEAIVLGIIQGLTEFIPVSSTAHLILVPWLFGWQGDVNSLSFDIALHGGTLLSLLVYFARDIYDMLFRRPWVLFLLIIATVPAAVVGVLFEDIVATTLRSPVVISVSLVIFGLYMLFSERGYSSRLFGEIKFMDAIMIGIAQAVALIPGVSRSGITISTGLLRGIKREDAARFSFLLSLPVIGGATMLEAIKIIRNPSSIDMGLTAIGFVSSAVSGFITISFLLWFFRRFSLRSFVYYRIVLAVIIYMIWLKF